MITRTDRLSAPRARFASVLAVLAVLQVLVSACSKDTKNNNDDNDAGDTDTDADAGTQAVAWEFMDFPADVEAPADGYLRGVGGTTPQDVVVGGSLQQECLFGLDGGSWAGIDVTGCAVPANIGAFCQSDVDGTLWAAPTYPSSAGWPVLRRQDGDWSSAPAPDWWLPGDTVSGGLEQRGLACLTGGEIALVANGGADGVGRLAVFDGAEWTIAHVFPHATEGEPRAVFGAAPDAITVFTYPFSTGGAFFDGAAVTPLSLPVSGDPDAAWQQVTGVAGDAERGYFAVGYWDVAPEKPAGFVWRSDDLQTWEEVDGVPHLDPEIFNDAFFDVDVDDAGNVYVVGIQLRDDGYFSTGDRTGVVLRYDGSSWYAEEIPPLPDAAPGQEWWTVFYGVWCVDNQVFIVGGNGSDSGPRPVVLRYSPPEDL